MSALTKRANDALSVNPDGPYYTGPSDIRITTHGSDFYWAITAVMMASTLAFVGASFMVQRRNRVFHYITAAITLTASIAYFTMGSNLGQTAIAVEFMRSSGLVSGQYREIFYVRYIDWFVTTPLLLLDLLLTCGMPWPTTFFIIFLDEAMIVSGLVGALVASSYKWAYFVFAWLCLFGIAYHLIVTGTRHARRLGPNVHKTYKMIGAWLVVLWSCYGIAWALAEGGNVISPDGEAVFYGVLDFLAKPVYGALLLWGHRNIDPAALGLVIHDYEDDELPEKTRHNGFGTSGAHPHGTTATSGVHEHSTATASGNAAAISAEPRTTTGATGVHDGAVVSGSHPGTSTV